jgi:hypothetical protein
LLARQKDVAVRRYQFYGLDDGALAALWMTVRRWLVPEASTSGLRDVACLLVLATLLVPLLRCARTMHDDQAPGVTRFAGASLLLGSGHLGFILAARVFADPWIPFSDRLLAPTLLPLTLGAVVVAAARFRDRPALIRVSALVLMAWSATAWREDLPASMGLLRLRQKGLYLTSTGWCQSPTMAWLASNARGTPVWSNWASAIALHTGRSARDLPLAIAGDAERTRFGQRVRRENGIVVTFALPAEWLADAQSVTAAQGLVVVAQFADGTVWAPAAAPVQYRLTTGSHAAGVGGSWCRTVPREPSAD